MAPGCFSVSGVCEAETRPEVESSSSSSISGVSFAFDVVFARLLFCLADFGPEFREVPVFLDVEVLRFRPPF